MNHKTLAPSELILNPDGSIYHLHLRPEDISDTILTVGDPDRVDDVSKHFDHIELQKQRREFKTCTGVYQGKRLTVISTGIGTDNIDIVFNELDALANINLKERTIHAAHTSLTFIRIGTSGAIQPEIKVDSFLASKTAIGFDNLLHFYDEVRFTDEGMTKALMLHTNWNKKKSDPYVVQADPELLQLFTSGHMLHGVTATNVGFYGPQGRSLRLRTEDEQLNDKLASFQYEGNQITNLEMETSGIYGMSRLLGHKAISLNAILANRATQTFSSKPQNTVERLIEFTLNTLVNS